MMDFDDEFAGIADYARMYRALGFQAVPAHYPSRKTLNWKRPALNEWREYQNELVSDELFNQWFDTADDKKVNIGLLTGRCSGNLFVVDLDTHTKPESHLWWANCLDLQNTAADLESPTQRTGGGGLQILFRAPEGWTPPTIKTSIGVDIRGIGGFVVCAPSMHSSNRRYEWVDGLEPWNIPVAVAPAFLCEQIDLLAEIYGGHVPRESSEKTGTPAHAQDAWGALVDGREDYMFRLIWARLVDIARDCPIRPGADDLEKERDDLFSIYVRKVDTRLPHGPGDDKVALLEREGRGATEFAIKWRAALRDWDKITEHAKQPRPAGAQSVPFVDQVMRAAEEAAGHSAASAAPPEAGGGDWDSAVLPVAEPRPSNLFEVLSVDDIFNLPDPVFLVDGVIIEGATAFFYGAPGCGKTFIAMDLAFSLGADEVTHWFGKQINRHGPIVYISSEGTTDMKFRMMAWERQKKVQVNRKRFHFIRQPVNFMDPAHIVKLIQTVKFEVEGKFGEKPVMIIVDTVSRVLPGADENLQKDMTLYIQAVDAMRIAFSCAATGVHHIAKGGGSGMRGSSVFEGAANVAIQVERKKPSAFGVMTMRKIKEARDGWELPFELRDVDLGFGRSSLVALEASPGANAPEDPKASSAASADDFGGKQKTGTEPDMETCRKMILAIQEAWDGGYPWGRGRESDRNAAEKLSERFGFSVETCTRYVNMWHRTDVIVTDAWGEKGNKKGLRRGKGL